MNSDMKELAIKATIAAIITILMGFAVHSFLGISIYTNSIVIYDAFPKEFYCPPYNPEVGLHVRIQNNAPHTIPYFNAFYILRVTIEAKNDAYAYFIGLPGRFNFTEHALDLGEIRPGESREVTIYLHMDNGNLTLRIETYLNFFGHGIPGPIAVYFIEYEGSYKYKIRKL